MSPDALIYVMTGAVVVSAVALVIQAGLLFGVYKASKATRDQITVVAGHAESLLQSAQKALEQSRKQINDATTKGNEILDLTRKQLVRVDEVMAEATSRARIQMDRVEMVLDDTVSRLHATANMMHDGVMRPLREINAILAGVRTGLSFFFGGRRITVEQATHDEEMFI